MKYSVGYSLKSDKRFRDLIISEKQHIEEVYFSWGDFPNGRNSLSLNGEYSRFELQHEMEKDLELLSRENIKFNLLFNGNCYGAKSLSRELMNSVGDTVDYIGETYGLSSVTTTSPVIAKFIKANFPNLHVRASVNMSIGSIRGMDYLKDEFDGYYMKRELNRDIDAIESLTRWCKNNGKTLHMLANSGCLSDCSAHTFHDNLVSHEKEVASMNNAYEFIGACHKYLKDESRRLSVVRDMSYVRPEDIHLYDEYFSCVKLATRVNPNPSAILSAYISHKYLGAVTDILEPSHSGMFYPNLIDNSLFPEDFGKKVMSCDKNCEKCEYCKTVYENAKVTIDNF